MPPLPSASKDVGQHAATAWHLLSTHHPPYNTPLAPHAAKHSTCKVGQRPASCMASSGRGAPAGCIHLKPGTQQAHPLQPHLEPGAARHSTQHHPVRGDPAGCSHPRRLLSPETPTNPTHPLLQPHLQRGAARHSVHGLVGQAAAEGGVDLAERGAVKAQALQVVAAPARHRGSRKHAWG